MSGGLISAPGTSRYFAGLQNLVAPDFTLEIGALHSHPAIGESRVPPHGSGIRSMNDYVLYHLPTTPMDILSFWFSDKSRPKWFAKEPSFDAVVSARYGAVL